MSKFQARAIVALAAGAMLALAPATDGRAQDAGAGAGNEAAPKPSWVKRCIEREGTRYCEISFGVTLEGSDGTKRWLAHAGLFQTGDAFSSMFLLLPLAVRLANGVKYRVDTNPPKAAQFSMCTQFGCQAQAEASNEMVAAMKAGSELQIQAVYVDGRTVSRTVPLTGFTTAVEGPPEVVEKVDPVAAAPAQGGKGDAAQ
jgi:invasion protein IalB